MTDIKPAAHPANGSAPFALATWVALAVLVMTLLGLVWAGTAGQVRNFSAVALGRLLLATTLPQLLIVASWAALTGGVFALGFGSGPALPRAHYFAALSGAAVPVGMVVFGGFLGHLWPEFRESTGPLDRPLLTLPLLAYGVMVPWLLGRLARLTAAAAHPDR